MTQPAQQHRQDIHRRVCLSYGIVSDLLWREALETRQPVGNCSRCASGLMRPREPEQVGRRWTYEATCAGCGHTAVGVGPRPPKPEKNSDRKPAPPRFGTADGSAMPEKGVA
jgi:hypothetical protein